MFRTLKSVLASSGAKLAWKASGVRLMTSSCAFFRLKNLVDEQIGDNPESIWPSYEERKQLMDLRFLGGTHMTR